MVGLFLVALLQLLIYGIVGRAAEIQQKKEAQSAQELAEVTSRALEARVAEEVRKNRDKDVLMLQQDKLASIGLLAAGVAHEINNPMGYVMSNLNTLKGYAENLERFTSLLQGLISREGSAEGQRMAEEASEKLDIPYILDDIGKLVAGSSEGAERVKRIVTDLKNFSRSDDAQFKETDLNQCIQSTANVVRNEIKYVAELEFNLGDIPYIICNPQQINQVIANLLINAAHAIDGYGRITVTTSREGEEVILKVADTGRGIPEGFRSRIFDPFFTTKDIGKGTGLGLSISYGIIKKHDGKIGFETETGVGTTFTIRLPVGGPG
ncbi:MAG: ATP-binding protein [Spirochaetota bacterium]